MKTQEEKNTTDIVMDRCRNESKATSSGEQFMIVGDHSLPLCTGYSYAEVWADSDPFIVHYNFHSKTARKPALRPNIYGDRVDIGPGIELTNFYRYIRENIISECITAWYGNKFAKHHKKLQGVFDVAKCISQTSLPLPHFGELDNIIKTSSLLSHQAEGTKECKHVPSDSRKAFMLLSDD